MSVQDEVAVGGLYFRTDGHQVSGNAILLGSTVTTITVTAGATATVQNALTGNGLLVSGSGTLKLNGSISYSGGTTILRGTLAFGADQSLNGALLFGDGLGVSSTNVGTLDLSNADLIVNGAWNVQSNSTLTNQLAIGADHLLTVNGNVTIGSNANAQNTKTFLQTSGGGSLVVNNPAAGGSFLSSAAPWEVRSSRATAQRPI